MQKINSIKYFGFLADWTRMGEEKAKTKFNLPWFFSVILILAVFYSVSRYNYLLFHFMAEIFSVIIACMVFVLAWHSRRYADNHYFVWLGIAYLFIAGLDLLHASSYSGMNIFKGFNSNTPTQLWIAARYLEALALLAAPLFLSGKISIGKTFAGFSAIFILISAAIFSSYFPDAFITGSGLTPFKVVSEYVISFILSAAIMFTAAKRGYFQKNVFSLLIASMSFTVLSELSFTLYQDPYGLFNALGHYFKIISFYLIYRSIVITGLRDPQSIIFNKLKASEGAFRKSEERFRGTLDNMLEGCQIIGFDWRYLYVNNTAALHGRAVKEDLIGRTMMEAYPDIEKTALFAVLRQCMEQRKPVALENEFVYPGGNSGWFKLSVQPAEEGIFVLSIDITEKKRIEAEMRNLARFPEDNPNPVIRASGDGQVLYANKPGREMLGISGEDGGTGALPAALRATVDRTINLNVKNNFEFTDRRGRIFLFSLSPNTAENHVNLYGSDITELKKTERKLAIEQTNLKAIFNGVNVGLLLLNEDSTIDRANDTILEWVNKKGSAITGIRPGNALGCIHAAGKKGALCGQMEFCRDCPLRRTFESALSTGEPVHGIEVEATLVINGKAAHFWFELNADPVVSGRRRQVIMAMNDITGRKAAEMALKENQRDLNRAQAVAHIGSWRLDTKKNELVWSEENHRIFGVPPGEPMAYETFLASVHPADRKYVDEKWTAALAGAPYDVEHRIVSGNEIRWVREKAELEFDPAGELLGGFGTTQDITERKRIQEALRQSEEKYKALAETSPDCIKLFDPEGRLLYINKAGLEEHGLKSIEEATDWDYFGCMVEKDRGKFRKTFEKALAGETSTIEIEHTPEGANRDVCLETMTPVRNKKGEVEAVYGVSRDISDLKKFDRAKTEFVSMASHQLRTPLTSAGFALELLLKSSKGKIDGDGLDYLKSAYKDIGFMTDLVNRLLNISRIEMGTFTDNPKDIELRPFLKEVAGNLGILAAKKSQRIIAEYADDIPGTMTVDPNIFRNILSNLISNAIKYTPEKGRIIVSAAAKDSGVVIGITDTGPGIPAEMQPKVFTKLYKAHEMLRTEGESSGLGLYIAKLFTEELGGRIWFESKENAGTTFYVYLPLNAKKQ
ncbi:hypothetical protein A2303_00465 [Candidatus Falkowbacteria bacterium RIFOXYB2_FULL_47_14]|uniref:histidine kinase n=1 Tax=Candidatus Falkowbacteria bacterium RIFOXYA2_FULL_47_19 TaxID=1797994 RepID=A0A1F5SLV0_9BACT|nr:MAG: hypothetical protein A2227_03870 [Candidatus Falkowbacteria bacterium RIFOXYA2_FULL_47_19]OGF42850.1 MAG: hypothetical protein A2303_00465 [Candidatus Falkowbacteria bacterium RIFOXYB2_FULL_47_14]